MALSTKHFQGTKDQAKGFCSLMSLYEENYVRFNQLVCNLHDMGEHSWSRRIGDIDLYLRILERHKYTTMVLLTYRFQSREGQLSTPDIKICLYHDARQAEALSCCHQDRKRYGWLDRSACHSNIQWRWRMNRFLFKWLNYCLKSGHGFPQQKTGIGWSELMRSV